MWAHRHLLGIEQLSVADIDTVLDRAENWFSLARKGDKRASVLSGKTVCNLFFESSTRTRTSFEVAAKRLGADVVNVAASQSSMTKGETLLDTARNIESLLSDIIVVRHAASGAAQLLANHMKCSIVNAGDGEHEHPTQGLLDAFTIRRKKGRFEGLVVAMVGDIARSRVARSNAILLGKKGAEVRFCAPRTMLPPHPETLGPTVKVMPTLASAVSGADVVIMLRIQHERIAGAMISSTREYARTFGLNRKVLELAKPDAIVMHPGPINRGVELETSLADSDRSVILEQVEAGVAVRAAVLELVMGAA